MLLISIITVLDLSSMHFDVIFLNVVNSNNIIGVSKGVVCFLADVFHIQCCCFVFQGLSMRQIRFRFDGQPINETDTPSQVKLHPLDFTK